jgi:5-methylcytosine-specific restriction endonuclease McrA
MTSEYDRDKLHESNDDLWRRIIRTPCVCERCGQESEEKDFEADHVVSRGNLRLRWNLLNGVCLCIVCHKQKHETSMTEIEYQVWFRKEYPARWQYLQELKNQLAVDIDLEEVNKYLRIQLIEDQNRKKVFEGQTTGDTI